MSKKKVIIEVPEELRDLGEALQAVVDRVVAANRAAVGGRAVNYAPVEREIGDLSRAVERRAHTAMLSALDVDAPRVTIDGKRYARVERCSGPYYTMAGGVSVVRSLYREVGIRNGKTVDAVGLRVGAVGKGWLPETAKAMAFLVTQSPSREAELAAKAMGRLGYSRSAFEDVAHLMGEHYVPQLQTIEEAMISGYEPPAEAYSVSAALDRVSLPMEEPRPRPKGRPRKGAPKRPVARNYRMAWCGTVTLHDREGQGLQTLRYGLMPYGDPAELLASLTGDVAKLLEKRPDLRIAALADGAHDLWKLLEDWLHDRSLGVPVHYIVDLWHLLEKLGKAARVLHGTDGGRRGAPTLAPGPAQPLGGSQGDRPRAVVLWQTARPHRRRPPGP